MAVHHCLASYHAAVDSNVETQDGGDFLEHEISYFSEQLRAADLNISALGREVTPHAFASPAASDSSKFFQEPVFDGRNSGAGEGPRRLC